VFLRLAVFFTLFFPANFPNFPFLPPPSFPLLFSEVLPAFPRNHDLSLFSCPIPSFSIYLFRRWPPVPPPPRLAFPRAFSLPSTHLSRSPAPFLAASLEHFPLAFEPCPEAFFLSSSGRFPHRLWPMVFCLVYFSGVFCGNRSFLFPNNRLACNSFVLLTFFPGRSSSLQPPFSKHHFPATNPLARVTFLSLIFLSDLLSHAPPRKLPVPLRCRSTVHPNPNSLRFLTPAQYPFALFSGAPI